MSFMLTWFGHASYALEVDGQHLLLDPYLKENPAAKVDIASLAADYILISHAHFDHIGDAVELAERTGALVIANFEIANWFEAQGIKAHAQHLGGGFHYPFGYLKMTLALHGSGFPDGSYGGNPCGFLLTTPDNKRIYMACDTGLFGDMKLIGEEGLDLAVLPIGDNFTMGPDDALRAIKLLQPKHVIPVHYNTWELIAQDADSWAESVRRQTKTDPHVLKPGQSFRL
jgi:L-ascorbate metabolism protein UlaG (beta-lactamase superfamily)